MRDLSIFELPTVTATRLRTEYLRLLAQDD